MKKGQIISLDFIMSLVLLVLAVGLVLQLSEIENYNFKDKELKDDTQIMGKTAANNLVNSPKLVCELVDFRDQNTVLSYMSNCLPDLILLHHTLHAGEAKQHAKHGTNMEIYIEHLNQC